MVRGILKKSMPPMTEDIESGRSSRCVIFRRERSVCLRDLSISSMKLKQKQVVGRLEYSQNKPCTSQIFSERHEGIQLEKNKVTTNPGMRSLAKLCLNR